MSTVRSRQLGEKMDNAALLGARVANKFQPAMHRPDSRNPRLEFNCLVLIVQDERSPWQPDTTLLREVEPHPLDADVGAAACQCLICHAELSRKINREPRVSILEPMHTLTALVAGWLDHTLQKRRMEPHECLILEHC